MQRHHFGIWLAGLLPSGGRPWRVVCLLAAVLILAGPGLSVRAESPFERSPVYDKLQIQIAITAIRIYEEAPQDLPNDKLLAVATAYCTLGQSNEACAIYRKVLVHDPENVLAQLGCGATLADLGKYREAIPILKRTWEQTKDVVALVKLADCYGSLRDLPSLHAVLPDLETCKFDDLGPVLGVLLNYALLEPDETRAREALLQAMKGVPIDYIATYRNLGLEAMVVLDRFDLHAQADAILQAGQTHHWE
jgi:tetratricopeptide (TPR) repeat protein